MGRTFLGMNADGVNNMFRGIGSMIQAAVMAPVLRQQAQQQAALLEAQTYAQRMTGDKYGAEAEGLGMTNAARMAPVDASLPQYMQAAQRLFSMTGDTNMDRFASAGQRLQQMGAADAAMENPAMAATIGAAMAAAFGKGAYNAVGDSGVSVNQFTGDQTTTHPGLYSLTSGEKQAEAWKRRAQAAAAREAAGLRRLQAQGQAFENRIGSYDAYAVSQGQPLPSKRDFPGSNGAGEAARVRGTAEIISKVLADPWIAQEQKEELIRKNVAMFQSLMGGQGVAAPTAATPAAAPQQGPAAVKNPAAGPKGKTMPESIPKEYKQIGTYGGKPVYQGPDGRKFIKD